MAMAALTAVGCDGRATPKIGPGRSSGQPPAETSTTASPPTSPTTPSTSADLPVPPRAEPEVPTPEEPTPPPQLQPQPQPQPQPSRLVIWLTDAPFPRELAAEARVTFTRIDGHVSGSPSLADGWHTLAKERRSFDLLQLQNGVRTALLDADVPAGIWDEFRFVIDEAQITLVDGRVFPLKIPSGEQSGLKVKVSPSIVVAGGLSPELLIDFDVDESFVVQGNAKTPAGIKGFLFKPVIKAENLSASGRVVGTVTSNERTPDDASDDVPTPGVEVSVHAGGVVAAVTSTDTLGAYVLPGLPPGIYELRAEHRLFLPAQVPGVEVAKGNQTRVDVSLMPARGHLRGVVGGGTTPDGLRPVAGARVVVLGQSATATTDDYGRFTLEDLSPGVVVIVVDGYAVGLGRTSLVTEVVAGRSLDVDRAWILPPLADAGGAPLALDANDRTTTEVLVTSPSAPGASVRIAAGSHVVLPDGFSFPAGATPTLTLHRVPFALIANPLPPLPDSSAAWYAPYFYSLQPEGAVVAEGFELTLPNDQGFAPGTEVPFYLFEPALGRYELNTTLTVSADGASLNGHTHTVLSTGGATSVGAKYQLSGTLASSVTNARTSLQFGGVNGGAAAAPAGGGPAPIVGQIPGPRAGTLQQIQMVVNNATPQGVQQWGVNGLVNGNQVTVGPFSASVYLGYDVMGENPGTCGIDHVGSDPICFNGSNDVRVVTVGGTNSRIYSSPANADPDTGARLPEDYFGVRIGELINNPVALIDRTPPKIDSFQLVGGMTDTNVPIGPRAIFKFSATDAHPNSKTKDVAGLYGYQFKFSIDDGVNYTSNAEVLLGIAGKRGARTIIDRTQEVTAVGGGRLPDLVYTFKFEISDSAYRRPAGNSTTRTVTARIDSAPPRIRDVTAQTPFLRRDAAVLLADVDDAVDLDRVQLQRKPHGAPDTAYLLVDEVPAPPHVHSLTNVRLEDLPVGDGVYTYRVHVLDEATNEANSQTFDYTFDRTGPTGAVSVMSPLTTPGGAATVTIAAQDAFAGLASYSIERLDVASGAVVVLASDVPLPGGLSSTLTLQEGPIADGSYLYRVTLRDTLGNPSAPILSNVLLVDTQPPVVTFDPTDGALFPSGSVTLTAYLDDRLGANPSTIRATIDGAACPHTATTAPLPPDLQRTTVKVTFLRQVQGAHVFTITGADLAGNQVTASMTFVHDHFAPVVDSVTPTSEVITRDPLVTFRATYHDVATAVNPASVKVRIKSNGMTLDVTGEATISASEVTLSRSLADGTHTFELEVADLVGQKTVLPSAAVVRVDTVAPTIQATGPPSPPTWVRDPLAPLTATLGDLGQGIEPTAVRVTLDGTDVTSQALVTATTVTARASAPLSDGLHAYSLDVADRAGNVTTLTVPFQVDATGPTSPGQPLAGVRPSAPTLVVRWTASVDGASGVSGYRVLRSEDGGGQFVELALTTTTELAIAAPIGERTRLRVVALDVAGNESRATDVRGCEVASLHDLTTPVTTRLRLEVRRADGTPAIGALVEEVGGTGATLGPVAPGVYESQAITVAAGQALSLRVQADGASLVSHPLLALLPAPEVTDFGQIVLQGRRVANYVLGLAGATTAPAFTLGEPVAHGPPPQTSGENGLLSGFWNAGADDGEPPLVHLLHTPPVLCGRFVPIHLEVISDAAQSTDVAFAFSLDGGATYAPMTIVSGAAALSGTPAGQSHVAIWDTALDLAGRSLADVVIRATPAGLATRGDTITTTLVRGFSVERVEPAPGSLDLDPAGAVVLTFSADVDSTPANLSGGIVVEHLDGTAVPLTFAVSGRAVTLTGPFPSRTELRLVVREGLRAIEPVVFDQRDDLPGFNGFEAAYRTTGDDTRPPVLVSSVPGEGACGVAPGATPIVLVFDEALDPASVSDATFVVTSVGEGVVPVTVSLADPRTVLVVPMAGLTPGCCYTVSISPAVCDLAGNRVGLASRVGFGTSSPTLLISAPTIVSPTNGDVLTTAFPVITGTAAPRTEVRLYLDGAPTGLVTAADDAGDWSVTSTFPFPDGPVSIFAVASAPGGAPTSGPGASVSITVDAGQVTGTPTPPADLHEVLAGALEEPLHMYTLVFQGNAGEPFDVEVVTAPTSAGLLAPPELRVDAANGAGTYTLRPGTQVFSTGTFFDATGTARLTFRASDVVGEEFAVSLLGPNGTRTTQLVAQRVPVAFVAVASNAELKDVTAAAISLRARLIRSPAPVIVLPAYPLKISVVPLFGSPGDVLIDGQPGGAEVTTNAQGQAQVSVQVLDPEIVFSLQVSSAVCFEGGSATRPSLCFSETIGYVHQPLRSQRQVATAKQESPLALSVGVGFNKIASTCPPNPPATPTPPGGGAQKIASGNPVLLHNGGKLLSRTDLAIPGRGLSFAFTRTYKSFVLYSGTLGNRWTHGYDQRLIRDSATEVAWVTGADRTETFHQQADGTYRSPRGYFNRLTFDGQVGTIRTPDGTRLVFVPFDDALAPGRLEQIIDRHGNTLRLAYAYLGSGRQELTAVTDPLGRTVHLFYDGLGRIRELRDFRGRRVRYEYGRRGDLVRVTSPEVLQTTEGRALKPGQEQPGGRSEVYGYTSGFADARLNSLLTHVVAPAEAAALAGVHPFQLEDPARLTPLARTHTKYDTDPTSYSYARVVKQRVGGTSLLPAWTGQSTPQVAGGEICFSYEPLAVPGNASLNHPVEKTTVLDRNGNLTEYFHNSGAECVRARAHTNRRLRRQSPTPVYGEDPPFFERTWIHDRDGLPLVMTNMSGSRTYWVYGREDLNGDGLLTAGEDRNLDGDYDDPEDVQPEDHPLFAFAPGNGALDALPRLSASNLLRTEDHPDARGDTRGGQRPRVWTFAYEPVFNNLRAVTDPCGNDPTYTPQNGGVHSAARYTTTTIFDYEQAASLGAVADALGVTATEAQALLAQAGLVLGRGDLNDSSVDDAWVRGDPVRIDAPSVTLTAEQTKLLAFHGPVQGIVTTLEHDAFGQLVCVVDPEQNVHRFEYHPEGDPNGDGEPDSTLTSTSGGYLARTIVDALSADPQRNTGGDAGTVQVVTQFFQDPVGNLVRTIDPRGVEHWIERNPLNEVVRTRAARAIVAPSINEPPGARVALDYETHVFHDLDGRVVEVRVENAGERDGTELRVASNEWWTRKVAYDLLDAPVVTLAEVEPIANDDAITVSSPGVVVSRLAYDPNQNVVLLTKPEGNVMAFAWDERDLLFQATDGFGTTDTATVTVHYNLNGNPLVTVDSVKHDPTKWTQFPTGDVTRTKYDGFDQVTCVTDAELNCGDAVFDPCGRRVRFVRFGPPEEGRPRLLEVEFFYDEVGRAFRTENRLFTDGGSYDPASWDRSIPVPGAPLPFGEAEAASIVELDRLGRVVRAVDPKGDVSRATWDGAGRVVSAEGPEFATLTGQNAQRNRVEVTYNQAGQPVSIKTYDRSPLATVAAETFTSSAVYDALGRLIQATDPIGLTGRLVYDSRSNVIAASDPNSSVTVTNFAGLSPPTINGHGNVSHAYFDGLGRPIRSEVLLKKNGVGDGQLNLNGAFTNLDTSNPSNPDGRITITQSFDRNSRLRSRADDNGNTTVYSYDARDRAVYTQAADLTVSRTFYDADSMVRQTVDRNGTTLDRTYDAIGRLLEVRASRRATNLENTGQAVEGSVVQAFEYDGLSRLRLAVDQNDPSDTSDDVATSFTYDSLGRQRTERHRMRAQTSLVSTFGTSGRITVGAALIDRTITREFDLDSNRTATIYSSGRRLDYQLDGLDRLQAIRDTLGTITATEFLGARPVASTTGRGTVNTTYAYDANRRLNGLNHVSSSGLVAGFGYTWDRANRRATETHASTNGVQGRTESYTYDSASRITGVDRQSDNVLDASWVIDGVGNWVSRTQDGKTQTTNQRQNGRYAPDLMNEVQRLATFDVMGALVKDEQHTQDPNGNRIRSAEFKLFFDAFDRLTRVERTSDGATVGRYRYDALSRRVDRMFVARGDAAGAQQQVFHVYDGAQEVEELNGSGAVIADYVWGGAYIDQCVQMRRGGQEYYLHTNSIFSVVAATNAAGQVVERYDYKSIYGVAEVRDASGTAKSTAAEIGNPWRFQGRRFDSETGFYYFRNRYLDPAQGRFVSRDPIGMWGDASNLGNGYAFAGNDPVNRVDPMGLDGEGGFGDGSYTGDAAPAEHDAYYNQKVAEANALGPWSQGITLNVLRTPPGTIVLPSGQLLFPGQRTGPAPDLIYVPPTDWSAFFIRTTPPPQVLHAIEMMLPFRGTELLRQEYLAAEEAYGAHPSRDAYFAKEDAYIAYATSMAGDALLVGGIMYRAATMGLVRLSGAGSRVMQFHSGADVMRTRLGPAYDSAPLQYAAIREVLEKEGVTLRFSKGEYAYGAATGRPGNLVIDPDASISAWRHEYYHFLFDQKLGYPGFAFYGRNPHIRWASERGAYLIEIHMARQHGDDALRRALVRMAWEERRKIFGTCGR